MDTKHRHGGSNYRRSAVDQHIHFSKKSLESFLQGESGLSQEVKPGTSKAGSEGWAGTSKKCEKVQRKFFLFLTILL